MTPLKFSTALLASLAVVLIAHPAAAAKGHSQAAASKAKGHASPGAGDHKAHGSDHTSGDPFSLRFAGFLPVDYLKWGTKKQDEPEIRLCRSLPAPALLDADPSKGASEWKDRAPGLIEICSGQADSRFQGADSHGAKGRNAYALGRYEYGSRGKKDHGKNDEKSEGGGDQGRDVAGELAPPPSSPASAESAVAPPDSTVTVTAVPEPTTALFGAALLGVCSFSRRRSRSASAA